MSARQEDAAARHGDYRTDLGKDILRELDERFLRHHGHARPHAHGGS